MLFRYALALLCCLLFTVGQMLCKLGVNQALIRERAGTLSVVFQALATPYAIAGLFTYAVATVVWFYLLSRFDFSYVYPFMSLTFILALLASRFVLRETVPANRWIGVAVIVLGVILSGRK